MPEVSPEFIPPEVAEVFAAWPDEPRRRLEDLRRLIFATAASRAEVGPLEETLKWGEPAYLTTASKSGSTIRIGWKAKTPDRYYLYVHCQTRLVEIFRGRFGDALTFEGKRAIVLDVAEPLPAELLAPCIETALLYKLL